MMFCLLYGIGSIGAKKSLERDSRGRDTVRKGPEQALPPAAPEGIRESSYSTGNMKRSGALFVLLRIRVQAKARLSGPVRSIMDPETCDTRSLVTREAKASREVARTVSNPSLRSW
jgi:hypothetical protein